MTTHWRVIAVLAAFAFTCASTSSAAPRRTTNAQAQAVELYNENETLGPIYYPRAAASNSPEVKAAHELADYLTRLSGHEWLVEREDGNGDEPGIYVGHTMRYWIDSGQSLWSSRDGLTRIPRRPDEYFLRVGQERIVISGNTSESTGRAVAHFLGDYAGVRWFIPGPLGESVPSLDNLALKARHGWFVPTFDSRWLRVRDDNWNRHNRLDRWLPSHHNLYRFITQEDYTAHPEWMPLVNGERDVHFLGRSFESQPDVVAPGFVDHVAKDVVRAFARDLSAPSVSIGMNDSIVYSSSGGVLAAFPRDVFYRGKPDASNLVFAFSNDVAQEVFGQYRLPGGQRYVSQLAYLMHERAPEFPVDEHVAVYIATDRSQWYDPQRKQEGIELLESWAESGAERYGMRDYYYGKSYFIPRVFPSLIAESMGLSAADGATLFMAETDAQWGFDGPKLWLTAQLSAKADADSDALLDEYYTRFYGPAAVPMRAFFELCEAQWMNQPGPARWIKYYANPAQAALFPPEVCETLSQLLTEAANTVADGDYAEPYRERVALTQDAFQTTQLACRYYASWLPLASNPLATEKQREDFREAIPRYEELRQALSQHMEARKQPMVLAETLLLSMDPRARLASLDWRGISIDAEDFRGVGLPDYDAMRESPEMVLQWQTGSSWNVSAWRAEGLKVTSESASNNDTAMRVEGADRVSFYKWYALTAGENVGVRVQAKGKLSPGCVVRLMVRWEDADGQLYESYLNSVLPEGDHAEWVPLAVSGVVPVGATKVYVGLKVQHQFPDDWVAFRDLLVIALPKAVANQDGPNAPTTL